MRTAKGASPAAAETASEARRIVDAGKCDESKPGSEIQQDHAPEQVTPPKKYHRVNSEWPKGTRDGRDIKPTPQEALSAARRLYRIALGRPFKGPMLITSGNRATWIRRGAFYVNPDWRGGGWHELVHSISHYAARKLYGEAHGPRHAFIERNLVHAVVTKGWLDGKLRRSEKRKPDPTALRRERLRARLNNWERKRRRADTAIRKLKRSLEYYERKIGNRIEEAA